MMHKIRTRQSERASCRISKTVRKNKSLKGIFNDSNNIFLWHESENINNKILFPKFQLIPILRFQVVHDYVCFVAPIDYPCCINA